MNRQIRRAGAARLVALVITLAIAVPAFGSVAAADTGDLGARLAAACARVAPIHDRVTTIITRLENTADVRGSLAWFEAEIARATSRNHPKIAADLQGRHDVLEARLAVLHKRIVRLDRAATFCTSHGIAV
ncbi:MAG: hypothetical protein RLZZ623_2834 [Actinomycetota bacterium]|jgi:hypothetical protein